MAYQLEHAEGLVGGLSRVAREAAETAAIHLRDARGDRATAVHEARKRSKEARAALRLLRAEVGAEPAKAARAAFRDAARRIADARDAEVAAGTLARLGKESRLPRADRRAAEEALERRRRRAMRRLTDRALAAAADAFSAAGARLPGPAPEPATSLARELARVYRRGGRAMRRAWRRGDEEAFHLWRHETKDLWYAVRLLAGAWPGPLGALAAELRELASVLGEEHDLTVLSAALAEVGGEPPLLTPALERAIARRRTLLRERARPLGERLWAEPADAFGDRLAAYWTSWRDGAGA